MFPGTPSIIIAAIWSLFWFIADFTDSISLNVHTIVSFITSSGTPRLVGALNVSVPEPDFTSRQSE
ncbi:hypothetical protein SDC9_177320 [bioreactor metagenome]|uniref:Uncharacterized protein n=1 Tax=bioreactor metagenome TaxID=1076179 RepID=A0A645GSI4_9ZZZZ